MHYNHHRPVIQKKSISSELSCFSLKTTFISSTDDSTGSFKISKKGVPGESLTSSMSRIALTPVMRKMLPFLENFDLLKILQPNCWLDWLQQ